LLRRGPWNEHAQGARLPTPQVAWVHQIHAAGGARSGSNIMVMLFVMLFVIFVQFLTLDVSVVLIIRTL
jgi:hypothetical protein